jgi:predicted Rossmann-fold nucleotide-binding protein
VHDKPCGLLNIAGYFDGLLSFIDGAVKERFVRDAHRAMLIVEEDPRRLLERFESYEPPRVRKWITAEAT